MIMTKNFIFLKTATALMLLSAASFASADVVRCQGDAGDVTYTDSACDDNVQSTQFILVDKPQAPNVSYQTPSKAGQIRSSNWATTSISPRAKKVDAESVRSARIRMIAMDGAPRDLQARK